MSDLSAGLTAAGAEFALPMDAETLAEIDAELEAARQRRAALIKSS